MMRLAAACLLAWCSLSWLPPASAQVSTAIVPVAGRTGGGSVNHAPRPGVYTVMFVDAKGSRLRLRNADGKTFDANVAAGAYDLSRLKMNDKVRIDFAAQETPQQRPTAASIWPAE